MILAAAFGGLGNQLFQFATARHTAHSLGADFQFYQRALTRASRRRGIPNRRLQLEEFFPELTEIKARRNHVLSYGESWPKVVISSALSRNLAVVDSDLDRLQRSLQTTVREKDAPDGSSLIKILQEAQGFGHLIGHWQDVSFFPSQRPFMSQRIRDRILRSAREREIFNLFKDENPVCVHVRRGDYRSSQTAKKSHGLTPSTYFVDAVEDAIATTRTGYLWVFSEDIEHCKETLSFPDSLRVRFVPPGWQNLTDAAQMSLIANGAGIIASNSTYSWWAASSSYDIPVWVPSQWSRHMAMPTQFHESDTWRTVQTSLDFGDDR